VPQVVNILVLVGLYAGVVCAQLTVGERALREERGCGGAAIRAVLSVFHAGVGLFVFFGVEVLLNVIAHGDYRRQAFGPYGNLIPICGGLFGLLVPWLPLFRGGPRKRGENDENGDAVGRTRLTGRMER
jgi:hypothetical protein